MKNNQPYNTGDLKIVGGRPMMILGHVWWPVEKHNAYHCIPVDDYGTPKDAPVEYIWDNYGGFKPFAPKVAA